MRRHKEDEKNLWMLFDPAYTLVDQAVLESKRGNVLQSFDPVGENVKEAMQMHIVLFSWAEDPKGCISRGSGVKACRQALSGNVTRMEPDTGHHLRVRMEFHSKLLYMRGRTVFPAPLVSFDMSAGGIAFFTPAELEQGEECEIVLPVTSTMLVVRMRILHGEAATGQQICCMFSGFI